MDNLIDREEVTAFQEWLAKEDFFVIVCHASPDGDAIGASLGFAHYLKAKEKSVTVVVPDSIPDFLYWMPCSQEIIRYDRNKDKADLLLATADVICCLDFNAPSRVDEMAEALVASKAKKIMVDHHPDPSDFCQLVISKPSASSTSELIFRLVDQMGGYEDLSKAAAECVYAGMMTDTGGFTYNSNNKDLYTIISRLLEKKIDKDAIYRKVYNNYSEGRLRLMGFVLYEKMRIFPEYHAALITLTREEMSRFQFVKGDTEGLVNIPLQIKGIYFSAFLREDTDNPRINVSLRSEGTFPCNKFAAAYFSGGGHLNASGGRFQGSLAEAVACFEEGLKNFEIS